MVTLRTNLSKTNSLKPVPIHRFRWYHWKIDLGFMLVILIFILPWYQAYLTLTAYSTLLSIVCLPENVFLTNFCLVRCRRDQ
jgi:hypothetical protein